MIDPPPYLDKRVRQRVAVLLSERGWSEDELRARAGIPVNRFRSCMNGARSFPLKDVWDIAVALEVGFDQLIQDEDESR